MAELELAGRVVARSVAKKAIEVADPIVRLPEGERVGEKKSIRKKSEVCIQNWSLRW